MCYATFVTIISKHVFLIKFTRAMTSLFIMLCCIKVDNLYVCVCNGSQKSKSSMIKQINVVKSKLLKHLDDLEQRLITEVASTQEKKREKDEISQLTSVLKDNQEIEFIKDHDVINIYLLVLRKQIVEPDNAVIFFLSSLYEVTCFIRPLSQM